MQIIYGMRCGKRRMMEMLNKEIITQIMIGDLSAKFGESNPDKVYIVYRVREDNNYYQVVFSNKYAAIELYATWINYFSHTSDYLLGLVEGNLSEPNTNSFVIGELDGADVWVDGITVLYRVTTRKTSLDEYLSPEYHYPVASDLVAIIMLDLAIIAEPVMLACAVILSCNGINTHKLDPMVLDAKCIDLFFDFKAQFDSHPLDLNQAKVWLDNYIKEG